MIKTILGVDPSAPASTYTITPIIPKYEYDIAPCPICNQPVTSFNSTLSWGAYSPTSQVDPCGHSVSYTMTYTDLTATKGVYHIKIEFGVPSEPSPGQFVYSLASPEPIAYAANNGPIYKMEDFKQYHTAYTQQFVYDYTKSLDAQMLYGINTPSAYTGAPGSGSILGELLKICPGLANVWRSCPDCKTEKVPLSSLIPHVNDSHQWSREKIAEWLDIIALEDPTVDLTIKSKEKNEQPSIGSGKEEVAALGYGTVTLGGNAITKEY